MPNFIGNYGGYCIENHSVFLADRGGRRRVAQLLDLSQVVWDRRRDEVSEASLIIRGAACAAQADLLRSIEPKRNEIIIYRGNERVWEGPVSRVGWHRDWVEVAARDIGDYIFARPLSIDWDNSYPNTTETTTRMEQIIRYELNNQFTYRNEILSPVSVPGWEQIDPPANIEDFLQIHHFPNEVRTSAHTTPYQMTVGEHLDNFARTGGIDYTVIGRALHIWDVSRSLGKTRTLTEADFFGEIIVTAYGADHASVAFAVANDGRYGGAGGVATDWRFREKTQDSPGQPLDLPPSNTAARRPSLIEYLGSAWNGYRYWMAYERGTTSRMRLAGSKDGIDFKDLAGVDIDADPAAGVTASVGTWPAIASGYSEHIWMFFVGGTGHLYRTRTADGRDWTSQIDLLTPAQAFSSPSVTYLPTSERWVIWGIQNNQLVWYRSTTKDLDGSGQLGSVNVASITDVVGTPQAIEMRSIGGRWVGLLTTSSGVQVIESRTSQAAQGFRAGPIGAIAPTLAGQYDTLGKASWLHAQDGSMKVRYGASLAGVSRIFRTNLTGPVPVIGTGDKYMDYYGPWTKIFTVYDEEQTTPPTQADLNSQAKRNLTGRSPVPIEVRVPDNSGIRLSPGLTIDMLVPGTEMPLLATLNSRPVSQLQKLHHVTVTETADGESIQVTLVPATKPDDDIEEEPG